MFRKDFHQFRIIDTVDVNDECSALQNIMRLANSILMEYKMELNIPKQGVVTTFPIHVKKVMTSVERK